MTNKLKILLTIILLWILGNTAFSQARLIIENDSRRHMTVKVMKSTHFDNELHETVHISPHQSETIYFSETGNYFTKTKAELTGANTIYRKGDQFRVYNGHDGYSVMTLTFSITESAIPLASGGEEISKKEFDEN